MRAIRFTLILLLVGTPTALMADVSSGDLPTTAKWYFHVDFEEMRSAEAGKHIYTWLQGEVFEDVREDAGVDIEKEVDRITAFAATENGLIVLIEGDISQESEDKLMAVGAASGGMDKFESGGDAYYYIKNDDHDESDADDDSHSYNDDGDNFGLESLENGAYFSFAVKNKVIVTSSEAEMKSMLSRKGKIDGSRKQSGALLVLSADRSLIQAGLDTDEFGEDMGWDSNILRNAEQVALLIADEAGKLAIQAQLVTAEKAMADSLASIVRGLIALQVFNDGLDPEISEFLQSTSVDVDGNKLTLKVALDPEVVIAAIE